MKSTILRNLLLVFLAIGMLNSCATTPLPSKKKKKTTQVVKKPTPPKPPKPAEQPKSVEKDEVMETEKQETPEQKSQVESELYFEPEPVEEIITVDLPELNREFRAAWVATVANINWPSKKTLTTEEQKMEAISLLEQLKDNNFNAVIFQVRPASDALYDSPYEPWSVFLTGRTGTAPYPYYDPLEFWVEEAHKRGLELHVWLNPYRAHHSASGQVTSESIVNKMPNEIVRLANGMHWFDPGLQATQDHISNVVKDIVRRYDIDGVHIDDYFYPYKEYNKGKDFPDQYSYNQYRNKGGTLTRDNWRRDNVNTIIERLYREIKAEKHWVKFGISPFGIWRSGYPAGVAGLSQFDELYADAKLWLNEGWLDYFAPQLYWSIDAPKQSFPALLEWWESENTKKRHLWPGLNTVQVRTSRGRTNEIEAQIELDRQIIPNDKGVIHWSIAGLNWEMLGRLRNGLYREKALIPKSTWLDPLTVKKPELLITSQGNSLDVNWMTDDLKNITHWVLYKKYTDGSWETEIFSKNTVHQVIPKNKNGKTLDIIAVQAIDRLGNESEYETKAVGSR